MMFDFKKKLGSGNFGEVWLVKNVNLNAIRALKCFTPDQVANEHNLFQEAQILKNLEHNNVVKVYGADRLPDGRVYIEMEHLIRGSLYDEIEGSCMRINRARKIMIDVLRGLEFAHSKAIIHCDIKPSNILIGDSSEGKLADFGLALTPEAEEKMSDLDLLFYCLHMAPEIEDTQIFDELTDIFSCGVTLYRMVNGDAFLPQIPILEVPDMIVAGKYPNRNSYRMYVPRALRIVINRAMNIDPDKRYSSANEMRRALEGIIVAMNWDESVIPDGTSWISGHNGFCYKVTLTKKKSLWFVETKKGRSKRSMRRVGKYCKSSATKNEAVQFCKNVLQGFVTGEYS